MWYLGKVKALNLEEGHFLEVKHNMFVACFFREGRNVFRLVMKGNRECLHGFGYAIQTLG